MKVGFVSTRFSGTDGVSLEATKWAEALARLGHESFWFSGLSDRPTHLSMVIPEAHFEHDSSRFINARVWQVSSLTLEVAEEIERCRTRLLEALIAFRERFALEAIVVQNALAIPMNLPLGLALADFLEATGLPCIAHHHDFYWERERFAHGSVGALLDRAFPCTLPHIRHVVINSQARRELTRRCGVDSTFIPNVMDFANPKLGHDSFTATIKEDLGFAAEDILFLQPTRVVPRKGIEHAIELLAKLGNPRHKLIVSHESGDEGPEYQSYLTHLAVSQGVDLHFIAHRVGIQRGTDAQGRKIYSLLDVYPIADFVTYPSLYEGFGNALVEALYFRKPTLVRRYPVFVDDIEPLGFQFVLMDDKITDEIVNQVATLIQQPELAAERADTNFMLAARHFSYDQLTAKLETLLSDLVVSS